MKYFWFLFSRPETGEVTFGQDGGQDEHFGGYQEDEEVALDFPLDAPEVDEEGQEVE